MECGHGADETERDGHLVVDPREQVGDLGALYGWYVLADEVAAGTITTSTGRARHDRAVALGGGARHR